MAKETVKATEPVAPIPTATAAHATTTAPAEPKGPRSYLVMMVLAILMMPSGLARAYRGEQIGWTRFWIYVGATVACAIPFLNILAILALIALFVWGVIDVFQLRNTKTDADGGTLLTTERDEKFAKGFFIYFIVVICLSGVGILFALIFGAVIISGFMNALHTQDNRYNTSPSYNNSSSTNDFWQDYYTR